MMSMDATRPAPAAGVGVGVGVGVDIAGETLMAGAKHSASPHRRHPCRGADGEVTEVVDSIADHAPHVQPGAVTLANIAGNHIILQIAPQRYVLYAQLERG